MNALLRLRSRAPLACDVVGDERDNASSQTTLCRIVERRRFTHSLPELDGRLLSSRREAATLESAPSTHGHLAS